MAQFYSWYNLIQASSTVSAQQPARRNGTCQHGKSRCRGDARQVSFWIGDAREAREGSRRCTSTEAVRVDRPAWVLTSCTTFLCGHAVPSLSRTAASLLLPCIVWARIWNSEHLRSYRSSMRQSPWTTVKPPKSLSVVAPPFDFFSSWALGVARPGQRSIPHASWPSPWSVHMRARTREDSDQAAAFTNGRQHGTWERLPWSFVRSHRGS